MPFAVSEGSSRSSDNEPPRPHPYIIKTKRRSTQLTQLIKDNKVPDCENCITHRDMTGKCAYSIDQDAVRAALRGGHHALLETLLRNGPSTVFSQYVVKTAIHCKATWAVKLVARLVKDGKRMHHPCDYRTFLLAIRMQDADMAEAFIGCQPELQGRQICKACEIALEQGVALHMTSNDYAKGLRVISVVWEYASHTLRDTFTHEDWNPYVTASQSPFADRLFDVISDALDAGTIKTKESIGHLLEAALSSSSCTISDKLLAMAEGKGAQPSTKTVANLMRCGKVDEALRTVNKGIAWPVALAGVSGTTFAGLFARGWRPSLVKHILQVACCKSADATAVGCLCAHWRYATSTTAKKKELQDLCDLINRRKCSHATWQHHVRCQNKLFCFFRSKGCNARLLVLLSILCRSFEELVVDASSRQLDCLSRLEDIGLQEQRLVEKWLPLASEASRSDHHLQISVQIRHKEVVRTRASFAWACLRYKFKMHHIACYWAELAGRRTCAPGGRQYIEDRVDFERLPVSDAGGLSWMSS